MVSVWGIVSRFLVGSSLAISLQGRIRMMHTSEMKTINIPVKCRKCGTIVDQSEIVKLGIREEVQFPDGEIVITPRVIVDLCKDCYREKYEVYRSP